MLLRFVYEMPGKGLISIITFNDLFVVSNARGKKVGEKLFKTSLEYIRENDFSSMTWETAKDNAVAQSLYNKMGGKLAEWLFCEIR